MRGKPLAIREADVKGEHSLLTFNDTPPAPCPPSKAKLQAWQEAGADPAEKPRTFFRLTAVFDRSQVDELPPPAEPAPLEPPAAPEIDGGELAPWLEPLIALAGEIGSTVTFEAIASGADGYYRPKTKAIVVEAAHAPNRRVKTLVHELAHGLVRADHQDQDPELDPAAEELVAETVIFWREASRCGLGAGRSVGDRRYPRALACELVQVRWADTCSS